MFSNTRNNSDFLAIFAVALIALVAILTTGVLLNQYKSGAQSSYKMMCATTKTISQMTR
jgi:hypothetical protein